MALKRSVALTGENGKRIRSLVGYGGIQFAVSIQIADRDGLGRRAGSVEHLLFEGSVAIARQHRDSIVDQVGGYQVKRATAGETRGSDAERRITDGVLCARLEGAIPVSEQDRDRIAVIIGGG